MIGQFLTLFLTLLTLGVGALAFQVLATRRAVPVRVDVRPAAPRRDDDVR